MLTTALLNVIISDRVMKMNIYNGARDKKAPPTNHTVAVVSANRILCGSVDGMTIRKNGREDWSLFYCEKGRLYFENTVLESGQIFIYPPLTPQKYICYAKDKTVYRYLHFTGSDVAEVLSSLGIEVMAAINTKSGSLSNAFDSIRLSMLDSSPLSKIKAEYYTLYIISQIAKVKKQGGEITAMKNITDSMEHDFASEYDALRYAGMLNVSVSRFNHLFKENVGQSPYNYFLKIRMENAVGLLENTNLKIKDIAQKCGFPDPLYFSQVFKRMNGVTPSAYRKSNEIPK